MRALDCVHEAHEDKHFTGADDDELVRQVMQHRDQYHPEMTDEQVQEHVTSNAYDE